ncbi:MAG: T9SS type A sorting domain-containing protein [Bacteroidia bacterium]
MKKRSFFFAALLLHLLSYSQAPQMRWLKAFSAPPGETLCPQYAAVTPGEHLVIAGWQQRSWDPWSAIFIMEIDSSGNELWRDSIETIGSSSELYLLKGISVSPSGEIVFGGEFAGTITGSGITVSESSPNGAFIARYNAGTLSSLISIGAGLESLASDRDGNTWLALYSYSVMSAFGISWPPSGYHDMVLCKISPSNNLLWSKQLSGNVYPKLVSPGPDGAGLLFGTFTDTLFFGSSHYPALANGAWGTDQFVMKVDSAGNIISSSISPVPGILQPTQALHFGEDVILTSPAPWNHGCDVSYQRLNPSLASQWRSNGYYAGVSEYGTDFLFHHIASIDPNSFWAFGISHRPLSYSIDSSANNFELHHYDLNGTFISRDTARLPAAFQDDDMSSASGTSSMYFAGVFYDSLSFLGEQVYGTKRMFVFRMATSALTSIAENENPVSFELFPNPANENITVRFGQSQRSGGKLVISDLLGKIVMESEIAGQTASSTVDTRDLRKGVYLAVLHCSDMPVQTRKFCILH